MPTVPAITVLTISSALLVGLVFALLGHLKLALSRRPDQGDVAIGRLLGLLNFTIVPLILFAGALVDLWGIRPMLIAGSILLALSFLALSAGATYTRTLLAVCTAALGASALWIATIVLMPWGLFSIEERTASLQFGLVLIALGALITPPLFDLLEYLLGFRRTMAFLALILLAPAFLAATTLSSDFPLPALSGNLLDPLQESNVWLAALVFFVYAPLEAFVGVWTTTYLNNFGQPQRQSWWLGGFWFAMFLSRTLFALLQHSTTWGDAGSGWFLVLPALLAAVVLGNMAGTLRPERAFWGLVILGLALGPLFPILVGLLFQNAHVGASPGTTFGFVYAAGSLGSLMLAPLVNLSASARNIQTALRIPLFIALVLTAVTLLFALSGTG